MNDEATDLPPAEVDAADPAFEAAVLAGLSQPQKTVPARYLYDRRGSELFEAITRLPEYYPTRTEVALLEAHGPDIGRLAGRGRVVVEFGSGSSAKTRLLLRHVQASAYVPVDISASFLKAAADDLARDLAPLDIRPLAGDFTHPLRLPDDFAGRPMLGFFPGSTIGNLTPAAAVDLLRAFGRTLGSGALLLIGIDLKKDPRLLETAYDDDAGVTAAFNRNLLDRINRELEGTIPVDAFEHRAVWNDARGRIEMHLAASRPVRFSVRGQRFAMTAGETIHTENSHKYTPEEARLLGRAACWDPAAMWVDEEHRFSLHLWRKADPTPQP